MRRFTLAGTRENRSPRFPARSDTNRPVQSQKKARSLKFRIYEEDVFYYLCSEAKGADQLGSNCTADLRLCFRIGKIRLSHANDKTQKYG